MEIDRGKLLYDESPSIKEQFRKKVPMYVFGLFIIIIPTIITILGAILYLQGITEPDLTLVQIFLLIFAWIFMFVVGIIIIYGEITTSCVKVFETGFTSPHRTIQQSFHKEENYFPFSDIIEIYPNMNNKPPYMTIIRKSNQKPTKLLKIEIKDNDKFLSILQNKVNIIWDRDYFI